MRQGKVKWAFGQASNPRIFIEMLKIGGRTLEKFADSVVCPQTALGLFALRHRLVGTNLSRSQSQPRTFTNWITGRSDFMKRLSFQLIIKFNQFN